MPTRNQFVSNLISELLEEGKALPEALATAEAEWEKIRPKRARRGASGTRDELYELLREGPVDDERFKEWLADGSENIRRHERQHDKVRKLANGIWADKAEAEESEAA